MRCKYAMLLRESFAFRALNKHLMSSQNCCKLGPVNTPVSISITRIHLIRIHLALLQSRILSAYKCVRRSMFNYHGTPTQPYCRLSTTLMGRFMLDIRDPALVSRSQGSYGLPADGHVSTMVSDNNSRTWRPFSAAETSDSFLGQLSSLSLASF